MKKQIKVKLQVAKFLQDTLEATALKSKKKRSDDALPTQFVEFMKKVFLIFHIQISFLTKQYSDHLKKMLSSLFRFVQPVFNRQQKKL